MLAFTISGPFGQVVDPVDQLCSKLSLGSWECGAIRAVLTLYKISPETLIADTKAKGRAWLKEKIWAALDVTSDQGKAGTGYLIDTLYDKLIKWTADQAGIELPPATPPATSGGLPKLPAHLIAATKLTYTPYAVAQSDKPAASSYQSSAAADIFKSPMTWAVVGGVAVVGIAALLLTRK